MSLTLQEQMSLIISSACPGTYFSILFGVAAVYHWMLLTDRHIQFISSHPRAVILCPHEKLGVEFKSTFILNEVIWGIEGSHNSIIRVSSPATSSRAQDGWTRKWRQTGHTYNYRKPDATLRLWRAPLVRIELPRGISHYRWNALLVGWFTGDPNRYIRMLRFGQYDIWDETYAPVSRVALRLLPPKRVSLQRPSPEVRGGSGESVARIALSGKDRPLGV